jgi:penicillin amidase
MMRRSLLLAVILLWAGITPATQSKPSSLDELAKAALSQIDGAIPASGLKAPVEVLRDRWGVPHIYAQSTEDLYFAQGYVMAQDRLWQMEMWRRSAEGRLAEVLGPDAVARDRYARMLRYRGPVDDKELSIYHPEARTIMTAYVAGVNAFIDAAMKSGKLPVEFVLTGIEPEPWTIESLISRQNTFGDASSELQFARSVAELGAEEANRRRNPDPWEALVVPEGLEPSLITDDVVAATRAGRAPNPTVLPQYAALTGRTPIDPPDTGVPEPGSNNWVVSGALSATGKPVVANDPHREVALPSLRYIVHLNAPGWNVAGSTEPPFLGVAIGHNERIGWGLTIVGTDQHDVYVEELNPANENEVRFNGAWEPLRIVREQIAVKGQAPETIGTGLSSMSIARTARRMRCVRRCTSQARRRTSPDCACLRSATARLSWRRRTTGTIRPRT